ncbi:MAG TPA: hypothetical protein VL332_07700 [Candidatus Saccharimonadaceae bacterium]|jgi:hypothetical protein|nr:hypothetical protein [Candidatus Saccharimonadaceae bacterium]
MKSPLRRLLLSLTIASSFTVPALASAAVEFTPVIGVVHPLKAQYVDFGTPLVFGLSTSAAYGARVTWWAQRRVALEASAVGAGTMLKLVGGGAIDSPGTLFQGDGRVRFRLNPANPTNHFDLIGGVGLSDAQFELTDFLDRSGIKRKARTEWVVGAGATVDVWSNAALRIDVEDHLHARNFEFDPAISGLSPGDRGQQDLTWTAGVVIPICKR